MSDIAKRDTFTSKLGFVISTIGFSVGIGTLWRFPYLCGEYGGGLFLLTYILLMVGVGIPLFSSEITLGMITRQSPVGAYKILAKHKAWQITGWCNMISIVFVIGYTVPVFGWIIHYFYATVMGTFVGMDSRDTAGYFISTISNYQLVFLMIAINIALTMLVVRNSLQKGIELLAKILLPALAVIIIILICVGLSLPNSGKGLVFFFTPDFENYTFKSVLAALGQTFFSIGIAMAVGLIFGSYKKEGEIDIVKNTTIVVSSVIIAAIMAGCMIFPLAAAFGLPMGAGPGLTFITMPNVFNQMAGGILWGAIFYVAFYIAAFTSGIAGWEAVIAFLMDQFGLTRTKAMFGTLLLVCMVGIPATLSDVMFNLFDMLTNNVFLVTGAFLMTIFVGWVWGMDKLAQAAGIKNDTAVYYFFLVSIKFIAPIIVIVFSLTLFGIL